MNLRSNTQLSEYSDIGDARLNKRLSKICNGFSKDLNGTIPQNSGDRSSIKATYNFFKNEKVDMSKLIAAHCAVHQKDKDKVHQQVLLVLQDSTDLIFTNKRSANDFGPMNYEKHRGCRLHNSLIVSPSGVPIGLFKQSSNIRKDETFGKRKSNTYKKEPIEDKESYRWIAHFKALQDYYRATPNIEVYNVCDREADIFEFFAARKSSNVHLIVRSNHNRKSTDSVRQGIHDKVKNTVVKDTYQIKITNRKSYKKRKAKVELRYCEVETELKQPTPLQKELPPQKLWIVHVKEVNPPKGTKAVEWILICSRPIEGILDAKRIIKYYELRWIIERFHYVLKSGAKITELQLHTARKVLNAVAAYSISAVNVMRINYLARIHPQWSYDQAGITEIECKILYQHANLNIDKNLVFDPLHPPNIKQVVVTIARLGGFTNFSNQPFPGLKTFWRGWEKFQIIMKSFNTFMSMN